MNNELKSWFLRHKDDKPDNLYHSETFKIMRKYLKEMGYWKVKSRGKGNPDYFDRVLRMANQNNEPDYEN